MLTREEIAQTIERAHWPQSFGSHERALWIAGALLPLIRAEVEAARVEIAGLQEWIPEIAAGRTGASCLADAIRRLVAETARLRAALRRYGAHEGGCPARLTGASGVCDCGLAEALAEDRGRQEG